MVYTMDIFNRFGDETYMKVFIHFKQNCKPSMENGFWDFETLPDVGEYIFLGQQETPWFKVELVLNSASPYSSEIFVSQSDIYEPIAEVRLNEGTLVG